MLLPMGGKKNIHPQTRIRLCTELFTNACPLETLSMFTADDEVLTFREKSLLRRLQREYTPDVARKVLLPLITQTSPVSLRALDWAVVNWSKQHNIVCASTTPGEMTNIHHAYRNALQFWKRRLFDPFRRRSRIVIAVDGVEHETTLGQANFALWTYQTGVLAYVLSHIDVIEQNMNQVSQRQKRIRHDAAKKGVKRKRRELTPSQGAMCIAYRAPIRVHF